MCKCDFNFELKYPAKLAYIYHLESNKESEILSG